MLLYQINPTFFTILNSLDMMIDVSPKEQVHKMIAILTLLKYGLDTSSQMRTLKDEMNYISEYLYIQWMK